ncbi:hypothetical protein C7401_10996 [Paraburkholderia unamae]|uniref:hypothetical protein n=1 Tax=Paraburkholderia unamae TaxID=219649 RepID=UPI000DC266FC|nr:hypothetical protein [Paraburkholderia unamae]RAR60573.1 hypothetical protein C7401_10996 [Paraburkholderia unamae]
MQRADRGRQLPPFGVKGAVLTFFMCFFLFMSSGRLGSFDAGQQLGATVLAIETGHLGTARPPNAVTWVPGPDGLYYEPHDLGAVLLMYPATWIALKAAHVHGDEAVRNPPLAARVGVALTYSLSSAIGCYFLFLLFAGFYSVREAFLISFAFAAGSFFLPYAKSAWDVLPCASAVCAFLYYAQRIARRETALRVFVATGAWLAVACTFRYSIGPALLAALAFVAWKSRAPWRGCASALAAFFVLLVPTFLYNVVRTGSFVVPATASDYYLHGLNAMDGNPLVGFAGLLFGPNRGLFIYCPILLVALVLPSAWRELSAPQKRLIKGMLLGSLLYTLMISRMAHWGAFGWGPRYLLPFLPVFFLVAGPCLVHIARRSRPAASVIVIAALAWNLAPATTNWHVPLAEYPGASLQESLHPYALEGSWTMLEYGLNGQPAVFALSDPAFALHDDGRRFPDFWTARLIERAPLGTAAGWFIIAMLLAGMAAALRRIVPEVPEVPEVPAPGRRPHTLGAPARAAMSDGVD